MAAVYIIYKYIYIKQKTKARIKKLPLIWHVLLNHVDFAVRINFEFGCALDNCGNFNHLHKSSMAAKNLNNQVIFKTAFKIRMMMSDISKH